MTENILKFINTKIKILVESVIMGDYWVHTKVQETQNEGKGREKSGFHNPMVDDQTYLRVRHVDDCECMISA